MPQLPGIRSLSSARAENASAAANPTFDGPDPNNPRTANPDPNNRIVEQCDQVSNYSLPMAPSLDGQSLDLPSDSEYDDDISSLCTSNLGASIKGFNIGRRMPQESTEPAVPGGDMVGNGVLGATAWGTEGVAVPPAQPDSILDEGVSVVEDETIGTSTNDETFGSSLRTPPGRPVGEHYYNEEGDNVEGRMEMAPEGVEKSMKGRGCLPTWLMNATPLLKAIIVGSAALLVGSVVLVAVALGMNDGNSGNARVNSSQSTPKGDVESRGPPTKPIPPFTFPPSPLPTSLPTTRPTPSPTPAPSRKPVLEITSVSAESIFQQTFVGLPKMDSDTVGIFGQRLVSYFQDYFNDNSGRQLVVMARRTLDITEVTTTVEVLKQDTTSTSGSNIVMYTQWVSYKMPTNSSATFEEVFHKPFKTEKKMNNFVKVLQGADTGAFDDISSALPPVEFDPNSTDAPTIGPTTIPSSIPSASLVPTKAPNEEPTTPSPTIQPSSPPTDGPSMPPTIQPTTQPSALPSNVPTTKEPTANPTTQKPTAHPTPAPSNRPTIAPETSTTFFVTGGYPGPLPWSYQQKLESLPYHDGDFLIHLGDWNHYDETTDTPSTHNCDEDKYDNFYDLMSSSSVPVFVLPGDQETTRCPRPRDALEHWKHYFLNYEYEYWDITEYSVRRQPTQETNFQFEYRGVMYLGVNAVGGPVRPSQANWNANLEKNILWITNRINKAAEDVEVAVLFQNGDPNDPTLYEMYTSIIESRVNTVFNIPLLIVHINVNGNRWNLKQRYHDVPNLMVLEVEGGTWPPMRVEIDTKSNTFNFDQDSWYDNL